MLSRGRLPETLDRAFEGGVEAAASAALTTAYGWFYHWLNRKGVRAFPEDLFWIVLDHAEARFVVAKRARAALLPATETCTSLRAAARCGVTQGGDARHPRAEGIAHRPKERGRPIRIAAADIRAIETVMRNSVDADGATTLLGTGWKVVRDLTALGAVAPWIVGGRATKHA